MLKKWRCLRIALEGICAVKACHCRFDVGWIVPRNGREAVLGKMAGDGWVHVRGLSTHAQVIARRIQVSRV